jgi:uncharacterized membrane protein
MEKQNNLKEELLKQMGQNYGSPPNDSQNSFQAIIAKDTARLRRLKRAAMVSWFLSAASFVAAGIIGAVGGFHKELWIVLPMIGVQALLIIAVSLTFVLSTRSRTLRMKQIQAKLSDIQEHLKKLSEDK